MTRSRGAPARYELREAKASDAPTMAEVQAEGEAGEGWDAAAIRRILATPGAFALVAQSGAGVAGFVLARVAADECEILSLAVRRAERRRGAGRGLLRAVLGLAAASGARTAYLEVGADNGAALALYRGEGFARCGQRARYYARAGESGGDAWVLRRPLAVR